MNSSIVKFIYLSLSLLVLMTACDDGNTLKTKSGLKVKILRKGDGTPAFKNGIAQLNLKYATEDGRILFNTELRGGSVPIQMTEQDKGLLDEVVDILNVGDSVSFEFPAEDLFEKTYGITLPDSIERGTKLKFNLCLSNTLSMTAYEGLIEEQRAKQLETWKREEEKQFKDDVSAIDDHLNKAGREYQKLKSGVRVVIKKKGKGKIPKTGEQVLVYYVGRYFTNGEVFDQSDKSAEPFGFSLGSGVIDGWSKGFAALHAGSSATLYIPSLLAYGPGGYREIPPNAILVFDVDFIGIGK